MRSYERWEHVFEASDRIHANFGIEIIESPSKLKNLYSDFATDFPNEYAAVVTALQEKNIKYYTSTVDDIKMEYLVNTIKESLGLSPEWSQCIAICILKLYGKNAPQINREETEKKEAQTKREVAKKEVKPEPESEKSRAISLETNDQKLISSGFSHLYNEKWEKAETRFDEALETTPSSRAYIGKLMVKLKISRESDLPYTNYDITGDQLWKKAMDTANGSYKNKLQRYEKQHKDYIATGYIPPENRKSWFSKDTQAELTALGFLILLCVVCFGIFACTKGMYIWPLGIHHYCLIMLAGSAIGSTLLLLGEYLPNNQRLLYFSLTTFGVAVAMIIIAFFKDIITTYLL